jgi:hypothetical protein
MMLSAIPSEASGQWSSASNRSSIGSIGAAAAGAPPAAPAGSFAVPNHNRGAHADAGSLAHARQQRAALPAAVGAAVPAANAATAAGGAVRVSSAWAQPQSHPGSWLQHSALAAAAGADGGSGASSTAGSGAGSPGAHVVGGTSPPSTPAGQWVPRGC